MPTAVDPSCWPFRDHRTAERVMDDDASLDTTKCPPAEGPGQVNFSKRGNQ